MPAKPILAIDNVFDVAIYPQHEISATEEPEGFEAFRVADGRRDETSAQASTPNAEWSIKTVCDQVRYADILIFDRGTNLVELGKRFILELSFDDFAGASSATTILDLTPPTVPGGSLEASIGVVTEELAWGILFAGDAAPYWRVRVPAMGAGIVPVITGITLGRAIRMQRGVPFPYADRQGEPLFHEQESDSGRIGRSRTYRRRPGTLAIRCGSEPEYLENMRPWLEDVYRDGSAPAWFCFDPDNAVETLINVVNPAGEWHFQQHTAQWPWPTASVPFIENAPELR